ncbi:uncharacterized protein LOC6581104 [Drosophila mojavensis]|uniref:C2H2-type domain-containing protein n=1 Tax=Drosophila mojavensis TaxID=7230 RepID=B4KM08_DROMO|nr:uncharacterized protein LOC6581104 [Drosophila mojavensis]XP_032586367.1 uncharacterized protein LOC6581104 [Drosophila mojavensis]XP_043867328.1 uncharacterized protein LOC6581104 [Drosophila mojavensis]XP_043867329.1 uncharacterized protein LOC6581104 [Drosophila mojavensis]EDW10797.2 uncharacterized protein Dmoj_GI18359 [Drosophila mojavensis]
MMEALEQHQTKSRPNNEPHEGKTETTPATSEEDDTTEEHINVCDLEEKDKRNSSPRELNLKVEQHDRQSPQENGRDTEESEEPAFPMANSVNESIEHPSESGLKVESAVEEKTTESDDLNEKPSTSHDATKCLIDIKVEQASPKLAANVNDDCESCFSDKPNSSPNQQDDQQNGELGGMDSPEMGVNAETSSINEVFLTDQVKVEDKSPLPSVMTDEEGFSPPVIKMIAENSPSDVEEISLLRQIPTKDNCTHKVNVTEETSTSPLRMQEEERSSSSSSTALKISENIKIENREAVDYAEGEGDEEFHSEKEDTEEEKEEASSPVYKNDEVDREMSPPAKATTLPVINDLSPASIPDDEESSQDFDSEIKIEETTPKLPEPERELPMEIIKIESDSENEDVEIESENIVDEIYGSRTADDDVQMKPEIQQSDHLIKERQAIEVLPKVKINGAHVTVEELQLAEESEREEEQAQITMQQSVIENENDEPQQQEQEQEVPHQLTRRSSTSSSDSSASQQLVIDQPESEQQSKQQPQMDESVQDRETLLAMKRRRSCSNSGRNGADNGDINSKHLCIEEKQQSSPLLLQRLQTPAITCNELTQCNASKFKNLQQLKAHSVQCKPQAETTLPPAESPVAASERAEASAPVTLCNPASTPAPPIKKERFFRCARCSTVHQCWNFFLHMREVHHRYICLYCSHVFASVEKLSLHLENKHDMDQRHFASVEAWQAQQNQEDRARFLVCCNCQASFERGSRFEDHDCAELMQPCALCGQKGGHVNGCRNGSTIPNARSNRKKTAGRRKRRTAKARPAAKPSEEHLKANKQQQEQQSKGMEIDTQLLQMPAQPTTVTDHNIPAPIADAPQEDPPPKLVVPKMMLRVPKEFQKSVDAELSSTDTEDEDIDELPSAADTPTVDGEGIAVPLLTEDAVQQQQQQLHPVSSVSEDTETATETASMFQETAPVPADVSLNELEDDDEDSPSLKLPHVLAEFERTKLDIERTMALIVAKKELQEQQLQKQQQQQQQQELQQLQLQRELEQQQQQEKQQEQLPAEAKQQRGRWSLTPPASPHNHNHIDETTHVPKEQVEANLQPAPAKNSPVPALERRNTLGSECMDLDDSLNEPQQSAQMEQSEHQQPVAPESERLASPAALPVPADGIQVAGEDTHTVDLQLDRPLDKFEMVDFIRLCLKAFYPYCLYCNHARRIAVNVKQLVLHLIGVHRFTATVDSITAEELQPQTIVAKLKSFLPALEGDHYMNSASCCSLEDGRFAQPFNERIYECFQCRYVTATHKELYTHNRRLHIKANISCCMCRLNFYSFSELLCHICPGRVSNTAFDMQFRCCLCDTAPLASAFRLMVHLRKQHQACDICLEDCHTQAKLSAHVWKHKLLHLCYRCGIAYRNKQDISKHLFWKHGTESITCKRCLQKRWRHVYHFCVPATQFTCEQCQFTFSKAIYLEVHKRQHVGDFRYPCTEEHCEEKFVSRKLLLKHAAQHEVKQLPAVRDADEENEDAVCCNQIPKMEQEEERALDTDQFEFDKKKAQLKAECVQSSTPDSETIDEADAKPAAKQIDKSPQPAQQLEGQQEQAPRKRHKKAKRNKASLEDLNLRAPNLSESDSSDDSASDGGRSLTKPYESNTHGSLPIRASVDDLDMPRVMLSPSSESDNEEQEANTDSIKTETEPKQEQMDTLQSPKEEVESSAKEKPKVEESLGETSEPQEVLDMWKNLLQNQPSSVGKQEADATTIDVDVVLTAEQRRPFKLHVAWSDHDYCKMLRTPPLTPAPSPEKPPNETSCKVMKGNASSDSETSSSSSTSDSDSSTCSCGSNCSCSSSGSSSSDDDSDNESQSSKKSSKKVSKKTAERPQESSKSEEFVNVTSNNEEEERPVMPSPKSPIYNESDFETSVSDTDEEFYDAHPQKMASLVLSQKRLALLSEHKPAQMHDSNGNYDIVENSRPSTPSLPEEASAFADKRERVAKNKKKKRERKSTCKSMNQAKLTFSSEQMVAPQQLLPQGLTAAGAAEAMATPLLPHHQQHLLPHLLPPHQQHLLPESPVTPLTHRPSWKPRMSEGSSCSDADGQLKRSKRTRRPNKFYGYTSDDENMSSVLAPPLQVGMQLIKPQPPPQLTWAKEDLPTPPKQQRSRSNHGEHHHHQAHHYHQQHHQSPQQNSHLHSNGSTRKRNRRATPGGAGSGSARRGVKRTKQQLATPPAKVEQLQPQLPPIPTLKIRPALLPASAAASDSSDSSSEEDENGEINVTSLLPTHAPLPPMLPVMLPAPLPAPLPPLPPATTAFNQPIPPALLPNPDFTTLQYFKANNIRYPIRPPAGARLAREGESVYCYCRCPYDEVSEMIACDGDNCLIEWFHFECVGIMVAPQGKWFCAECRPKHSGCIYPGAKPT